MSKMSDSQSKPSGLAPDRLAERRAEFRAHVGELKERLAYLNGETKQPHGDYNTHGDSWTPDVKATELDLWVRFARTSPDFTPAQVAELEEYQRGCAGMISRPIPGLWFRAMHDAMDRAGKEG